MAGCKRKGGASYNENDSAKAVNLARRSKKQKPGAGTLKRGLIRKTSSNDSTSLSSNYVSQAQATLAILGLEVVATVAP